MQVSKIYKYESLFLGNKKKINDKKEGSKGEIIMITDDINKMLFFAMVIFIILHARHYFKPFIKENLREKRKRDEEFNSARTRTRECNDWDNNKFLAQRLGQTHFFIFSTIC